MLKHECYKGQVVWVKTASAGKIRCKVIKVNPKNVVTLAADGTQYTGHPSFMTAATQDEAEEFLEAMPKPAGLTLGSVVKFREGTELAKTCKWPALVVADRRSGLLKLVPLGGDGGKYYKAIDETQVEVVYHPGLT